MGIRIVLILRLSWWSSGKKSTCQGRGHCVRSLVWEHCTCLRATWRRQWHPLQCSCLENPTDRGAWWAAVHWVAKSQAWLSDFTFTFHFPTLEKEMATHSSVLAWRIPGTAEPSGLPSMGSHRVGHNWSGLAAAEQLSPSPQLLSLCSRTREPQLLSPCAATTKVHVP